MSPLTHVRSSLLRTGCVIVVFAALAASGWLERPANAQASRPITVGVNEADGYGHMGQTIDGYTARVGAPPGLVMWFDSFDWPLFNAMERRDANAVVARGAIPVITWDPAYSNSSAGTITNAAVAAGDYDAYLVASARATKAWGKTVLIRFAHEMNGDWAPWNRGVDGNTAETHIAMWRHVVEIFRAQGATNVQWVWSPNVNYLGRYPFDDLYPGDPYVDWVALDGYNSQGTKWYSFDQIFRASYRAMRRLTSRPMLIAETASGEGRTADSKASWIRRSFLRTLPQRYPRIRAVIWFDRASKEKDWRLQSSPASLGAWRQVVASPLYSSLPTAFLTKR
jgi:hypothetical protein